MIDTPIKKQHIDRRGFLAAAGSGLVLAFTLPPLSRLSRIAAAAELPAGTVSTTPINAWIQIGTDESITIYVGASEMGQGIMSSLPQLVAEDLMVDWTRVRALAAPANPVYGNPGNGGQYTGGSMSIVGYYQPLRQAGAAARDMLIAAAAQMFTQALGTTVTPSTCQATHGTVVTTDSKGVKHTLTYGQLATLAATMPVPANPQLVPDSALRLIGQRLPRLDLPSKTDGSAQFGIDVRLPGMVYAAIKHCPVIGGTVAKVPAAPVGTLAVVSLGNAVAVVADNTWKAMQAAANLQVQWSIPSSSQNISSQNIYVQAKQLMTSGPALVAETVGNAAGALSGAAKKIDVSYNLPYLPHACMEPLNCTVSITANSCDVWAPTQSQPDVATAAATITGLPANQINVHTTFLGGGLGRKSEIDFCTQALQIAKTIGKPVKLTWSREEDFGNDQYRPFALVRVQAGLDSAGNVASFMVRNVSSSILAQRGWLPPNTADSAAVEGAVGLTYNFANRLTDWVQHPAIVPVGWWRSVGNSINGYVVECAIDELASAAGVDPLLFRQRLLVNDARSLAVLNAAAALGGWGTALPAGHAQGIAIVASFNSIAAEVVEISQPKAGMVTVHKVACAVDCGKAVNPDTIEAQMQSGIVHGLNAALWGRVMFSNGVASVSNFDTYRMLRMREMPQVSVQIIQSGAAIGGIGEVGVPPLAPALANAYFRLTGQRVRSLPLFPAAGLQGGGGGENRINPRHMGRLMSMHILEEGKSHAV